jgi:hypothetical protein
MMISCSSSRQYINNGYVFFLYFSHTKRAVNYRQMKNMHTCMGPYNMDCRYMLDEFCLDRSSYDLPNLVANPGS